MDFLHMKVCYKRSRLSKVIVVLVAVVSFSLLISHFISICCIPDILQRKATSGDGTNSYKQSTGIVTEQVSTSEPTITIDTITRKPNYSTHQEFPTEVVQPSDFLSSKRFDLVFKMVYVYFYANLRIVPETVRIAYLEHLRVWNNFYEGCPEGNESYFDAKISCWIKTNASDFETTFQRTIDSIRTHGFLGNRSHIPIGRDGFLMNGAHRLSAAIVLSRKVTVEHLNYTRRDKWNYSFFLRKGLSRDHMNFVVLQWVKIQLKIPTLTTKVYLVTQFSGADDGHLRRGNIILNECSSDKNILYEETVNVTRQQLLMAMHINRPPLYPQIDKFLSKLVSGFCVVRFIFFFSRALDDLTKCKSKITALNKDRFLKSYTLVPDFHEENLLLAEILLNNPRAV